VDIAVHLESKSNSSQQCEVITDVHIYYVETQTVGEKVAKFPTTTLNMSGSKQLAHSTITIEHPQLWGPRPNQKPNMYIAITRLSSHESGSVIDSYETPFGMRSFIYTHMHLQFPLFACRLAVIPRLLCLA
jgi:beta-galactosidase